MLSRRFCNCSLSIVKCKVKWSRKEVGLWYLTMSTHHILQQVFPCSPQFHSTQRPQRSWSDRYCMTSSPTPQYDSPPVLEVSGSRHGFWSGISRSPYQHAAQSCNGLPRDMGREQGGFLLNTCSKRNKLEKCMIISGRVVSNTAHTDHFLSSILEELTYSKTRCL